LSYVPEGRKRLSADHADHHKVAQNPYGSH